MNTLPSTMRHIDHGEGGPPSVMRLAQTGVPTPTPHEVLIRVAYAGVNRPEVAQRQGLYPPPPGASPILGLEVAGHVVAIGNEVSTWQVGDAVCALTHGGAYAEFVTAPEGQVLPVPAGLTLAEAAALPENHFTVWSNVFDRGRLQAGESLLVHGGSSGIGLTAIQMAHARGATVYTTVGSADKAEACLQAGATAAIDYRQEDFVARIKELTAGRGVDVILDMVGGDYVPRNLRVLAMDGRLVQIAFMQGSKVEVDLMHLMTRRLTITGSTLRPRSVQDKAAIAASLREHVWPLIAAGRIRVVIHGVYELADAARAHEEMEASRHIGKLVLKVAGG
jgi:NADPH2:quinone reductase